MAASKEDGRVLLEEKYATAAVAPLINNRLDTLAATAMAANTPRLRVITNLWRLRDSLDAREWQPVIVKLAPDVRKFCLRTHKATVNFADASECVEAFLKWYVFGICVDCQGTGHQPMPDAPQARQNDDCPSCGGSGHTSIRSLLRDPLFTHKAPLADALLWLHDTIMESEFELSKVARGKMKA